MSDEPMTRDEADSMLRQAIIEHAKAVGDWDGELLGDFMVIAHWSAMDGRNPYTVAFDRPSVPGHVAYGLLEMAKECVASSPLGHYGDPADEDDG